jgi:CubicO group peptidase (beta-lactamase class C family)
MKTALLCATMTTLATAADFTSVTPAFEAAVREEMRAWQIEGVAVAWVDGTKTVYEAGFGEAAKDSVFRAGSVSKLFNAIAVMQQVEQGKWKLDDPIDPRWLPENPFPGAPAVTLRQLLSHRSGLQRESTVGSYFDPSEPSLVATVASLKGSTLVTQPGAMTRYSNIGPSLAGQMLVEATGKSFEKYQAEHILSRIGMKSSAWLRKEVPGGKVLGSHLRVADREVNFSRQTTPLFDIGTIPSGNLYTTAGDLARFLAMLAADGDAAGGRVLSPASLHAMWEPQFDEKGAFGLAFALGEIRGHKTVGHGGAVYGHSTALTFLPKEKIGVVILANEDIVNARIQRLADLAISLMLETKSGEKRPTAQAYTASPGDLAGVAGAWESSSFWWELKVDGAALRGDFATQPCTLVPSAKDQYVLNSRMHNDAVIKAERDATGHVVKLTAGVQEFTRVPTEIPKIPALWKSYLGSYGPGFIPLVVREKFGHLYATTENMCDYRLTPLNRHVFQLPRGMYINEHLVFLTGPDGKPWGVDFCNMPLPLLK